MSLSIELSIKNFSEASKINGSDEFCFVIGDRKVFCHKFVAAFLSHSISQMILSDPTTNSFIIDTRSPFIKEGQKEDQFKQIIIDNLQNLIFGKPIEISDEEIQKFKEDLNNMSQSSKQFNFSAKKIYSLLLLNKNLNNNEIKQQLYSHLFSIISSSDESNDTKNIEKQIKLFHQIENCLNLFQDNFNKEENMISHLENYLNQKYSDFIDNIASHFYELEETTIINLNDFILKAILSSLKLQIKSEDSLLNILLKRRSSILENKEKENENNFFIECIHFEFLSEKVIETFLNEITFDEINIEIWERIKKRLVLPIEIKTKNERTVKQKSRGQIFNYDEKNPLNGIFHHLTQISNGNIQKNQTIEITCSRKCCGNFESIVEYSNSSGWIHINGTPSPRWLQIDFKSRKIKINSYVIKTAIQNEGNKKHIRSWKLEISNDGNKWEKIDQRDDVSELNGINKMKSFNVSTEHMPFRFIRIITDKNNWYSSDGFEIGKLELFGELLNE